MFYNKFIIQVTLTTILFIIFFWSMLIVLPLGSNSKSPVFHGKMVKLWRPYGAENVFLDSHGFGYWVQPHLVDGALMCGKIACSNVPLKYHPLLIVLTKNDARLGYSVREWLQANDVIMSEGIFIVSDFPGMLEIFLDSRDNLILMMPSTEWVKIQLLDRLRILKLLRTPYRGLWVKSEEQLSLAYKLKTDQGFYVLCDESVGFHEKICDSLRIEMLPKTP